MQRYYADYPHVISKKHRKNAKRTVGSGAKALCFVTVTLLLACLAAVLFAVSKYPGSGIIPQEEWYFVVVYERESTVEATLAAQEVTERGGAGFVLNDGTYKIVASVYKKGSDARAVAERMPGATVHTERAPKIKAMPAGAQASAVSAAFSAHRTAYCEVLEVIEALERGEAAESVLAYTLTKCSQELSSHLGKIEEIEDGGEWKGQIAQHLEHCAAELIAAEKGEDGSPSSRARRALCSVVYSYITAARSIKAA